VLTASLLMPLGAAKVMFSSKPKLAVMEPAPAIVAVVDVAEEFPIDIDPVEFQYKKPYPLLGVACIESVPLFIHTLLPVGVVDPPAVGFEMKEI